MSEWQDISTAPKDGTEIIIALRCDHAIRGFTIWCGYWGTDFGQYGWLDEGCLITERQDDFISWKPLGNPARANVDEAQP